MESNEDLIPDLKKIVDELEADANNSSAAFRLFEIAEHLIRGFIDDFEVHYQQEDHEETSPEPDNEESPQEHEKPEVTKTLPFAVLNHSTSTAPSFVNLRKNVNEWVEPEAEFNTYEEAELYLREHIEDGSILEVDWENSIVSVKLILQ